MTLWLPVCLGCRDKVVAAPPMSVDSSVPAPATVEWTLTLARLDAFLGYQRALLALATADAGRKGAAPDLEQRAKFDERARQQAGLTDEEVEKIETMISQVASRRLAASLTGAEEAMPVMPPNAKPEAPEVLAESLAKREKLKKSSQSLEEERARFGDQNINVLLQRESEVLRNWALLMGLPPPGK